MTERSHSATLRIPASPELLEQVYEWIRGQLHESKVPEHRQYEILLAVGEAVTNAIRHGSNNDPTKFVEIEIAVSDEVLTIIVADEGEGFDHTILPDPTQGENLYKPSGRGVYLLKSLADEIIFHRSAVGMTVQAAFRLRA
jgi:serine/threonine-protein kinase RsbW